MLQSLWLHNEWNTFHKECMVFSACYIYSFFYVLSFDSKVLIPFSSILFPFFSPRNLSLKCKFNQRTQCMWSKLIKHTIFVGETIWGENVFSCKLLNKTCYFHRSTKTHINMEKLLPASKISILFKNHIIELCIMCFDSP